MSTTESAKPAKANISLIAAAMLGVGGMMGAGLYTLLGLAATSAGVWLPVSFAIAGLAALFSVYSYSRLGATYPSRGGAAEFLVRGFGDSVTAGGLNVFQYLSYLIATSLYAAGFAEYVHALAGKSLSSIAVKLIGVAVVVVFAIVNVVGSKLVGSSETIIIAIESAILLAFIVLGFFKADPSLLTSNVAPGLVGVITASALLYVTYQGFGVVTNTSGEMANPKKELPRAMYLALGIVATIYLIVSTLVVMLVPIDTIKADAGHVLADAGQAVLGRVGFVIIAAAAILATASAVNATIFAASNIGYSVSRKGEISAALARNVGKRVPISIIVSAAVVVLLVVFFPLSAVGQMTSLAFLVVYGAVSWAHLKVRQETHAKAWPLIAAVVVNAALFVALLIDAIKTSSPATWITLVAALVGSFVFEIVYRRRKSAARGA